MKQKYRAFFASGRKSTEDWAHILGDVLFYTPEKAMKGNRAFWYSGKEQMQKFGVIVAFCIERK